MKQLLLYLPVLHAGYEALFARHADADEVLLLGSSFADEFPVLRKEIRALSPAAAARYASLAFGELASRTTGPSDELASRTTGPSGRVRVVEREDLATSVAGTTLVVPDEELMRALVPAYGLDRGRTVVWERTFLRWDRAWSQAGRPAGYDGHVTVAALDRTLLGRASAEAGRSSDWWRQVGAVLVREGEVLDIAHNEHRPTEYAPYVDGDPRNDFSRGLRADLTTAIHAEAALVGRAARSGTPLAGTELYVSTFPCPSCARLIAEAGVRRVYFGGPYAVLDGDTVLREAGVELVWVDLA